MKKNLLFILIFWQTFAFANFPENKTFQCFSGKKVVFQEKLKNAELKHKFETEGLESEPRKNYVFAYATGNVLLQEYTYKYIGVAYRLYDMRDSDVKEYENLECKVLK